MAQTNGDRQCDWEIKRRGCAESAMIVRFGNCRRNAILILKIPILDEIREKKNNTKYTNQNVLYSYYVFNNGAMGIFHQLITVNQSRGSLEHFGSLKTEL